jgi:hypothetical protein
MKKLLKNILSWFLPKPVAPVVKHEVRKVTFQGPKFTKAVAEASEKPKKKPAAKKPAVKK